MKQTSLRKQLLTRILSVLILITVLSGGIQLYFMDKQIDYEIDTQSSLIADSINQGIEETDLAAKSIEHQIDLKMFGYAKHIGDMLGKEKAEDITTEELIQIKEKLNLSGLTIFTRVDNDIVAVKATDQKEIGFSTKNFGEIVYQASDDMLNGKDPTVPGAYTEKGLLVLPIMMSGTYEDQPLFFKYAYYHPEGTDYFVNPYIEANEVYQFTQDIGPDSWIETMVKENSFIKEIAVLDPKVFENPELAEQYWPPMKKVVHGHFKFETKKDIQLLKNLANYPEKHSYVQNIKGEKVLKLFIPIKNNQVIYIALDYAEMTDPLYRHSIILFVTGLVSLLGLFLLSFGFFNRIYENIQKIIQQIKLLEAGDLTAKSEVNDRSELEQLSHSTNRMAERLNKLIKDTQEQATKTQRLSILLEAEASQSIEKMYGLSTEATMKSRDQLYEITSFMDEIVEILDSFKDNPKVKYILDRLDAMREVANDRTAATTDVTITLSDLLQSLHGQSSELSDISNKLLDYMAKFKL
ncbi:HAMP domain-containing protein [Bacillus canaveralius]|uniref:HAMP domain-containing protein n=1 Tax=Bacillus canaveralius TaxID=1403243 RepID=A0A2N5GN05_9BACI|nr:MULTISPECIES: HAMP domain-containing protein [Bacillus]PLR81364.1 HAMP domain-containing protein [Bacillus sp. V33-4]PLR83549.1 HAMP domain-containing protein [Bacillus canaveralius]PLS00735.1 HAMP domain-containing protein [Bacillus canaveralius]RSK48624.1 HAMP domain-containing protein [Bacillus canaveralius]